MNMGRQDQDQAADSGRLAAAPLVLPSVTWSVAEDDRVSRLERIRASIELSERDGAIGLSLERCFEACVGLDVRRTPARRHLKSALRGHAHLSWHSDTEATVRPIGPPMDTGLFREIVAAHLADVADRPFTPRLLVSALGITSRERTRWTKDGRLQQSGSVTISRGQLVSVPTYSAAVVEYLMDHPALLAAWRAEDAVAG